MAVGDAHVFPGFLTPVQTQISFQSHRLLFSHASAEVKGENTPEEISPRPGLELTTTRSIVRHPHHCNIVLLEYCIYTFPTTNVWTGPNSKYLQTTNQIQCGLNDICR